jgi:large subunit ribosomal protein L17
VARDIKSPAVVKKLFDTIGARFATRPGGYTRILRLGTPYLELVGFEYKPASKDKASPAKKAEEKKDEPKAEEKKPAAKKGGRKKAEAEA